MRRRLLVLAALLVLLVPAQFLLVLSPEARTEGGMLQSTRAILSGGPGVPLRQGIPYSTRSRFSPGHGEGVGDVPMPQAASPSQPARNITIYTGDLVLNGTQKVLVEDCCFILTGNLVVEDNANFTLYSSTFILNSSYQGEFNITVKDQAMFKAVSCYLFGPMEQYPHDVPWAWDNRTTFYCMDESEVRFIESGIVYFALIDCTGSSDIYFDGCEVYTYILVEEEANVEIEGGTFIEGIILTVKSGQSLGFDGLEPLYGSFRYWRLQENATLLTNVFYDVYVGAGSAVGAWCFACYGDGALSLLHSEVEMVVGNDQADIDISDDSTADVWCDDDVDVDISDSEVGIWLAFGPGTSGDLTEKDGGVTYSYWDLKTHETVTVDYDVTLINTEVSFWCFFAYGDASLTLIDCDEDTAFASDSADVEINECTGLVVAMIFSDNADLTLSNLPSGSVASWDLATDADIREDVDFDVSLTDCEVDGWYIIATDVSYVELESTDALQRVITADEAQADVVGCTVSISVLALGLSFINFTDSDAGSFYASHSSKVLIHSTVTHLYGIGSPDIEVGDTSTITCAHFTGMPHAEFDSCQISDDLTMYGGTVDLSGGSVGDETIVSTYGTLNATGASFQIMHVDIYSHAYLEDCGIYTSISTSTWSVCSLMDCDFSSTDFTVGISNAYFEATSCDIDLTDDLEIFADGDSDLNITRCTLDVGDEGRLYFSGTSEAVISDCDIVTAGWLKVYPCDYSSVDMMNCSLASTNSYVDLWAQDFGILCLEGCEGHSWATLWIWGSLSTYLQLTNCTFYSVSLISIRVLGYAYFMNTNLTSTYDISVLISGSAATIISNCNFIASDEFAGGVHESGKLYLYSSEISATSGSIEVVDEGYIYAIHLYVHGDVYMSFEGQSEGELRYTTIEHYLVAYGQSQVYLGYCNLTNPASPHDLYVYDQAHVDIEHSDIYEAYVEGASPEISTKFSDFYILTMGAPDDLTQHPKLKCANHTDFDYAIFYASTWAYLFNCTYGYIYAYDDAYVVMVSTHPTSSSITVGEDAEVHQYWHLAVLVNTPHRIPDLAFVEVRWTVNNSLVEKKPVSVIGPETGYTQFILYGSKINATGTYVLGDYGVSAIYVSPVISKREDLQLTDDTVLYLTIDPPLIHIYPPSGENRTVVEVFGDLFVPGTVVVIKANGTPVAECPVNPDGRFTVNFQMQGSVGLYVLNATGTDGSWATGTFALYDTTPLGIAVDVGSVHFRGEIAEFYVLVTYKGRRVDATSLDITLFLPDGTSTSLSYSQVATGLYKITYNIPSDAPTGTYTLLVDARLSDDYLDARGSAIRSFLLSPTLTEWNARLSSIQDDIAIIKTDIGTIKMNLTEIKAEVQGIQDDLVVIESDVGTILAKLDDLNATLMEVREDVLEIQTVLGELEVKIDDVNATLADLITTGKNELMALIETKAGEILARLDAINATIVDVIETRAEEVLTRLDNINTTISEEMHDYYVLINSTLGELEVKLDTIKEWLQEVNATIVEIRGDVAVIKTDTTTILAKLSALNSTVVGIRDDVLILNTTLGEIEAKIDALVEDVGDILSILREWTGATTLVEGHKVMILTTSELLDVYAEDARIIIRISAREDGVLLIFLPKDLLSELGVEITDVDVVVGWSRMDYDYRDIGAAYMLVLTYGPGSYDFDVFLRGAPIYRTLTGIFMLVAIALAVVGVIAVGYSLYARRR